MGTARALNGPVGGLKQRHLEAAGKHGGGGGEQHRGGGRQHGGGEEAQELYVSGTVHGPVPPVRVEGGVQPVLCCEQCFSFRFLP